MKIVFMGTPQFAVETLDAIHHSQHEVVGVVTVPDRQTGRGLKLTTSPVKDYAVSHNLPLLQPEKLGDPLFQEQLSSFGADIFVVVAFRMLPKSVWAMPPQGTFNLHASLLPQYRGAAPINWALINGETETGVTTFFINERIDEGNILLQTKTPITENDTAETLHDRLSLIGKQLVIETLGRIENNEITPKPQSYSSTDKIAPKIFKNDCQINWNSNGKSVVDFIRGLSPYPAATTTFTDNKGNLIHAKIFEATFEPTPESQIGTIQTDSKKQMKIGVNDGYISITSIQISGKKRVTIAELLRGYDVSNWKTNI